MTTGITGAELLSLAERVESAEGPDRDLDARIGQVAGPAREQPDGTWMTYHDGGYRHSIHPPAYTASIDCALTLVPEGMILRRYVASALVPHSCEVSRGPNYGGWDGNSDHSFALALVSACLRARAALAEQS